MKKFLIFLVAALSATMMYAIDPFTLEFYETGTIDEWTIGDQATLNESESNIDAGKYVYDIKGGEPNDAFLNSRPEVLFRTKNSNDKAKAFAIYPDRCFEFGGKNGVIVIEGTQVKDRITIEVAAKGSSAAKFADDAEVYPKNAVAVTEDLVLPAKGSEGADDYGYVWRILEFESLGGDVEIKEFAAGFRVRKIELHRSEATVDAISCAEAAALMPEEKNAETEEVYIVTGYVTETLGSISPSRTDSTINQQRFWMGDEKGGANVLQCYWGNLPDGEEALNVGDKITLTGHILNYSNTPEIKNGDIAILERAEVVPPVEPDTIEVSVAEAVEEAMSLEKGAKTDEIYAVTGYIHSIATEYSAQYGNISFWMADEKDAEESAFQAYRVKCTADEADKLGANTKVTVIAQLQRYYKAATDEKPEIDLAETLAGGSLVILDTDTVEPIDPSDPIAITCAEATALMPEESNVETIGLYIVTGYVTETIGSISPSRTDSTINQQRFWMGDEKGGANVLQCYWGNLPEGEEALNVGDKITLTGHILNYSNTPEIKNGDIAILERTVPETVIPEPEGPIEPLTLNFADVESIDEWTITNATLNEEESHSYTNLEHYAFDIKAGVPSVSLVTAVPHITFTVKNNSDKANAFAVAINTGSYYGYYQTGGKNGIITIKNTTDGDIIRLKVASKSSTTDANFADPEGKYPKNARALTEDLTLPARNSGTEGEDEIDGSGYVWRTIEYKSFGGNVEIKEFAAGFRVCEIAIEHGEPDPIDSIAVCVAEAVEVAMSLPQGGKTRDIYTVTGYVHSIAEAYAEKYGNISFWMADEKDAEESAFEAYRVVCTAEEAAKVVEGAKVSVTAQLQRYHKAATDEKPEIDLAETAAGGALVILESPEPIDPSDPIAITCAEAAALMPEESNVETVGLYIVTGYVTETIGTISPSRTDSTINQQRFWMADEKGGANVLQCYWGNLPEGEEALNVGDKITLTGHILNYSNTPEIKNGDIAILERGEVVPPVEPDTIEVSVAEAVEEAMSLEKGAKTDEIYAVTGYIHSIATEYSAQYGNISFWMADEKDAEESAFQAYRVKCTADEADKLGANTKVTVIAQLQRYYKAATDEKPEIDLAETLAGGSLVILDTDTVEPIDPSDPIAITCAEAAALMPEESNVETVGLYIVTGYVTETNGTVSRGQQCFWMDDVKGEAKTLQGYWCNIPEGEEALNVGDKITLTGHILNYSNTPEIKNGDVAILERSGVVPVDPTAVSVAEALAIGETLEVGQKTTDKYIITGYVSVVEGKETDFDTYGNQTYWITDKKGSTAASNEEGAFYIYRGAADEAVQAGYKVQIETQIKNYNGIIESDSYMPVVILERGGAVPQDTVKDCTIEYLDIDAELMKTETITLHLPVAPEIEDFIFIGWQTVESFIDDGILIQAVYEYNGDQSTAPAEVSVPGDPARKLVRNGNVYILRDGKEYTIQGHRVK